MATMRSRDACLLVRIGEDSFSVPLDVETTSVGAAADCVVRVTEAGLAPRHCIVQAGRIGHEVFDLFSDSGTFVNGHRVEAAPLANGDQIRVGTVRITYLASVSEEEPAPQAMTFLPLEAEPSFPPPEEPADPEADLSADESQETPERPARRIAFRSLIGSLIGSVGAVTTARASTETTTAPAAAAEAAPHRYEAAAVPSISQAQRFHEHDFKEDLVQQLRATPFYVLSVAVHAVLAILLSLFGTEPVDRTERPPLVAELDTIPFVEEELEEVESETEVGEPEVEEPDEPDVELIDEPLDDDIQETDEPLPEVQSPNSIGPFRGAGIGDFGNGFGGSGGAGLRAIGGGSPALKRRVKQLRSSGLDVVFVLDSTSSMSEVLDASKKQIGSLVSNLAALVPNFRLGVVTYRDKGDAYVTRHEVLHASHFKQVAFLDEIEADGGGTFPEAIHSGVETAVQRMRWSGKARRVIVIVGDAPPHAEHVHGLLKTCKRFARQRGVVHTMFTPNGRAWDMSTNEETRELFRRISQAGGGESVELEDGDRLTQRILELAVGTEHASALSRAVGRLDTSPEARRAIRLAQRGSPTAVARELRRDPPPEALIRELFQVNRRDLWDLYRELLLDEDLSDRTRWANAVLLRRLVRERHPGTFGISLMKPIRPDATRAALDRAIARAARAIDL